MPVAIPHNAIQRVSQSADPKKTILDMVGKLDGLELAGDQVLMAIYIRPERSAGGIIRPQTNVEEDVYQGKAGLVLKWGPTAFLNPQDGTLYEQNFPVGEWVVFKTGDAWSIRINGYPCRVARDTALKAKISDPDMVF